MQSQPCRLDIEFKDADGQKYKKTASVKGKTGDAEEVPLYTNKDDVHGEVREALESAASGSA